MSACLSDIAVPLQEEYHDSHSSEMRELHSRYQALLGEMLALSDEMYHNERRIHDTFIQAFRNFSEVHRAALGLVEERAQMLNELFSLELDADELEELEATDEFLEMITQRAVSAFEDAMYEMESNTRTFDIIRELAAKIPRVEQLEEEKLLFIANMENIYGSREAMPEETAEAIERFERAHEIIAHPAKLVAGAMLHDETLDAMMSIIEEMLLTTWNSIDWDAVDWDAPDIGTAFEGFDLNQLEVMEAIGIDTAILRSFMEIADIFKG
jgi:hypothetical protein